jgi:hypothetical protein
MKSFELQFTRNVLLLGSRHYVCSITEEQLTVAEQLTTVGKTEMLLVAFAPVVSCRTVVVVKP